LFLFATGFKLRLNFVIAIGEKSKQLLQEIIARTWAITAGKAEGCLLVAFPTPKKSAPAKKKRRQSAVAQRVASEGRKKKKPPLRSRERRQRTGKVSHLELGERGGDRRGCYQGERTSGVMGSALKSFEKKGSEVFPILVE